MTQVKTVAQYYAVVKWLMSIKGIGRAKARTIIEQVDDIEKLYCGSYEDLKSIEALIKYPVRELLNHRNMNGLSEAYKSNLAVADGIITYWDKSYPSALKDINDPPLILFYKGQVDVLDNMKSKLAIVGTRVPTDYGRKYGSEISKMLAQNGYVIVSGMAMGIDAVAHRAAIDTKGYSIGVLGCGVDQVYPKQNGKLYKDILEKGIIISEYEVGTQPHPIHFPERNRIIAGLSQTCFVIEAARKSGSLITAEMVMDLGRDVFALPGPIYSQKSLGCHELIQMGAEPIVSLEMLKEQFYIIEESRLKKSEQSSLYDRHPIVVLLSERGQLTFDEILNASNMEISELIVELESLESNKIVKNFGFFYHL